MGRQKKQLKAKEAVKLRSKRLANGNASLYLDYYYNGKREYEFLKLYLVPEKDQAAKTQNNNTLQAANAIKAQRLLDITNNKAGLKASSVGNLLLIDWLTAYKQEKAEKGVTWLGQLQNMITIIGQFDGKRSTLLKDIDRQWCLEYVDFLKYRYRKNNGKPLAPDTARTYQVFLSTSFNKAVRKGLMLLNPFTLLDSDEKARQADTQKDYLTIDEVKQLIATPCKRTDIKRAFLFSCFCGLRVSDVRALRWQDIRQSSGQTMAEITQKKTSEVLYLPLSDEALSWMPERGDAADSDHIFALPTQSLVNSWLRTWGADAGITKKMHFHTSRHTFATMMLTLGADLYTTSKLMGHSDIAVTQVYAKIVNSKKVEAVNLVNGVFSK